MRVLDRYITREFLKLLTFGIIALILVSTVVSMFERIDEIAEFKPPFLVTVTFFLARIPRVLLMVAPISMLLSTLIVLGVFARNSEVIAMLASGVSIYRILVPMIVIGLVVSVLMFGLNEFVVPTTNQVADESLRIMKGKPDIRKMAKIQIWFRGTPEKRIYYINALIPERHEIQGLTIFELNDQFLPVKRVDALKAIYELTPSQPIDRGMQPQKMWTTKVGEFLGLSKNQEDGNSGQGKWILYQGTERSLGALEKGTIMSFQERRDYQIRPSFSEFRQETKDPADMDYRELRAYIESLSASGYDVSKYVVDLRAKFAFPFVSFVMVIIGFPFALKSPRSGAVMGVGLSVFIGLTYWIILQFGISLGHGHILPPLLAAWISHIIFAATGFYLILSTRT
jgi:lipopolysaccharide export LptBFGC system permease protein LptF